MSRSDKADSKKLDVNLISGLLNKRPTQVISCPVADAIMFRYIFIFPRHQVEFYIYIFLLGSLVFFDGNEVFPSSRSFTPCLNVSSNYLPSFLLAKTFSKKKHLHACPPPPSLRPRPRLCHLLLCLISAVCLN